MQVCIHGTELDLDLLISVYSSLAQAYGQSKQTAIVPSGKIDQALLVGLPEALTQVLHNEPDPSLINAYAAAIKDHCTQRSFGTTASPPFSLSLLIAEYDSQIKECAMLYEPVFAGETIQACNRIIETMPDNVARAIEAKSGEPRFRRMLAFLSAANCKLTNPMQPPKKVITNQPDLDAVLAGDISRLDRAFVWASTPQGHDYWKAVTSLTDETLQALQALTKNAAPHDEPVIPNQHQSLCVADSDRLYRVITNGPGRHLDYECGFTWLDSPQKDSYWLAYARPSGPKLQRHHIAYFYYSYLRHCWLCQIEPNPPTTYAIPGSDPGLIAAIKKFTRHRIQPEPLKRVIEGEAFWLDCGFPWPEFGQANQDDTKIHWSSFADGNTPLPTPLRWTCLYIFALCTTPGTVPFDMDFPAMPPLS